MMAIARENNIGWRFDPSPPSGSRSGGNVAEYAFNPSINHFVREVIQNVLDNNSLTSDSVQVGFNLISLSGEELKSFFEAMQFNDLQNHLISAALQQNGTSIRLALDELKAKDSLILMLIEDYFTTGLTGDETGDSNFAALCRDELYSNKESNTAGGSYGLGKAVLWSFSGLSTVLFNSNLETDPGRGKSPRLIGRTELPWHDVDGDQFSGPGWFGLVEKSNGFEYATSVWSPTSNSLAEKLLIGRSSEYSGTSILLIGFKSPAQEDKTPKELADEIVLAVKQNYWPSIAQKKLRVTVSVKNSPTQKARYEQIVDESDITSPFLDCWYRYSKEKSLLSHELTTPGDVVEVPIEVTIPAKNDESNLETPATVSLLIRLANENDENLNTVVFFRGPGMVVNSYSLDRLSLTQRPFHAIIVCGEGRIPKSDSDSMLDIFLRAAEPPSHNEWKVTKRLKEIYRPGYGKLLDNLFRDVKNAVRKHVSEKIPSGSEGPQLLKNLFPLNEIGPQKPAYPQPFRVTNLNAKMGKEGWKFSGSININPYYSKADKEWKCIVDFRFCSEDGQDSSGSLINGFSLDSKSKTNGANSTIEKGKGVITAKSHIGHVDFEGSTDPNNYPIHVSQASVEIHTRLAWKKED